MPKAKYHVLFTGSSFGFLQEDSFSPILLRDECLKDEERRIFNYNLKLTWDNSAIAPKDSELLKYTDKETGESNLSKIPGILDKYADDKKKKGKKTIFERDEVSSGLAIQYIEEIVERQRLMTEDGKIGLKYGMDYENDDICSITTIFTVAMISC